MAFRVPAQPVVSVKSQKKKKWFEGTATRLTVVQMELVISVILESKRNKGVDCVHDTCFITVVEYGVFCSGAQSNLQQRAKYCDTEFARTYQLALTHDDQPRTGNLEFGAPLSYEAAVPNKAAVDTRRSIFKGKKQQTIIV